MTTEPSLSHPDPVDDDPEYARIRCGCGFEVTGADETENRWAYEGHACPNVPPAAPAPWYTHLLGFWGWAIVATVAYALLVAFSPAGRWSR